MQVQEIKFVELNSIKGIGPKMEDKLKKAGITSVQELSRTNTTILTTIEGIGEKKAQTLLEGAQECLKEDAREMKLEKDGESRPLELFMEERERQDVPNEDQKGSAVMDSREEGEIVHLEEQENDSESLSRESIPMENLHGFTVYLKNVLLTIEDQLIKIKQRIASVPIKDVISKNLIPLHESMKTKLQFVKDSLRSISLEAKRKRYLENKLSHEDAMPSSRSFEDVQEEDQEYHAYLKQIRLIFRTSGYLLIHPNTLLEKTFFRKTHVFLKKKKRRKTTLLGEEILSEDWLVALKKMPTRDGRVVVHVYFMKIDFTPKSGILTITERSLVKYDQAQMNNLKGNELRFLQEHFSGLLKKKDSNFLRAFSRVLNMELTRDSISFQYKHEETPVFIFNTAILITNSLVSDMKGDLMYPHLPKLNAHVLMLNSERDAFSQQKEKFESFLTYLEKKAMILDEWEEYHRHARKTQTINRTSRLIKILVSSSLPMLILGGFYALNLFSPMISINALSMVVFCVLLGYGFFITLFLILFQVKQEKTKKEAFCPYFNKKHMVTQDSMLSMKHFFKNRLYEQFMHEVKGKLSHSDSTEIRDLSSSYSSPYSSPEPVREPKPFQKGIDTMNKKKKINPFSTLSIKDFLEEIPESKKNALKSKKETISRKSSNKENHVINNVKEKSNEKVPDFMKEALKERQRADRLLNDGYFKESITSRFMIIEHFFRGLYELHEDLYTVDIEKDPKKTIIAIIKEINSTFKMKSPVLKIMFKWKEFRNENSHRVVPDSTLQQAREAQNDFNYLIKFFNIYIEQYRIKSRKKHVESSPHLKTNGNAKNLHDMDLSEFLED